MIVILILKRSRELAEELPKLKWYCCARQGLGTEDRQKAARIRAHKLLRDIHIRILEKSRELPE